MKRTNNQIFFNEIAKTLFNRQLTSSQKQESGKNSKHSTNMILQIIDGELICLPLPTMRQEEQCSRLKRLEKVPASLMERKLSMMAQDTVRRTGFIIVVVMYNSLGTKTMK